MMAVERRGASVRGGRVRGHGGVRRLRGVREGGGEARDVRPITLRSLQIDEKKLSSGKLPLSDSFTSRSTSTATSDPIKLHW
jgi:hypothetical protein